MAERKNETLLQSCIDFRLAEEVETKQQQEQAHLITTAGASYNLNLATDTIKKHPNHFSHFVNQDHEDCGAYKNFAGDDSDLNHQRHMDQLKAEIEALDPQIQFTSTILRLDRQKYQGVHTCCATAIILGDPDILRLATQRLAQENLIGNHDLITRPFSLTDHDSILNDLKISIDLHRPQPLSNKFKVFIFDRDEDNAMILEEKAAQIASGATIESIIISEAVQEESVA